MKTVRSETAEAVFSFSLDDVVEMLKSHASGDEATELMDFLTVQQGDEINFPQEAKAFLYVALDLLASNKGRVCCKACTSNYCLISHLLCILFQYTAMSPDRLERKRLGLFSLDDGKYVQAPFPESS